jgi:tyrosine-protein phosphatase SIW14
LPLPIYLRWTLGLGIAFLLIVVPFVRYRAVYAHSKRLREVDPGRFYRSGQMTAEGFAEAVARFGIRTIINLQDEYPDPDVRVRFLGGGTIKESELCRRLGVRYVYLVPDLISRRKVPAHRPRAIDEFLELLDRESTYPVLIHCRAGLHRTGVLSAVYRMEYQHWSRGEAFRELKANGFGEFAATAANDYVTQYILTYRRGVRHGEGRRQKPEGSQEPERRGQKAGSCDQGDLPLSAFGLLPSAF